ncbi:MAG: type II toxin-antitoxin system VapC family toxin [Pseudomonadota bacterium]
MILDASAMLVLLYDEPGSHRVQEVLHQASISAANYCEVLSKLVQKGVPPSDAENILASFDLDIVPVDGAVAALAGVLFADTKAFGLSLGDRICLATAALTKRAALTADRVWSKVEHDGLVVEVIR